MTTVSCWGGPLDGLEVARLGGAFRWFNEDGRSREQYQAGYHLYQWRPMMHSAGRWRYVGNIAATCKSCKAIILPKSDDSCPLCGKRVLRRTA